MCNLYSITKAQAAIIALTPALRDTTGNLPPMPGAFLGIENRCVVPFTSFSEFNEVEGGDIWFAFDESRPLAVFAGLRTNWTSVRKVKEGETTNDPFAFLTIDPNNVVGPIHPKAMPVILTTPNEMETWLTAP